MGKRLWVERNKDGSWDAFIYGVQWRSWPAPTPDDPNRTIDQISNVLELIRARIDARSA